MRLGDGAQDVTRVVLLRRQLLKSVDRFFASIHGEMTHPLRDWTQCVEHSRRAFRRASGIRRLPIPRSLMKRRRRRASSTKPTAGGVVRHFAILGNLAEVRRRRRSVIVVVTVV